MEHLELLLQGSSLCLNIFSVLILVWGVIIGLKNFALVMLSKQKRQNDVKYLTGIKNRLGTYILLSLEVLIAADIVESIAKPTVDDILKLAATVAIRTVISYFLNKEIRESEEYFSKQPDLN